MKRLPLWILMMVLACSTTVLAQLYYWVDEKGVKHCSSDPPPNRPGIQNVKQFQLHSADDASESEEPESGDGRTAVQTPAKRKAPPVTIYTTSWCGYCTKAKAWMAANKVPYKEIDIEASTENHRQYEGAGGKGGVPLIICENRSLKGWSEERMQWLLGW
ncbi:glutaredoxin family protein [bacterium]|nr:glutaredoxin family protein [bacterium]